MARFQKGDPRPPGAGRKKGQVNKQPAKRFYSLLDSPEFKLKNHVQAAVAVKDVELLKALAALLKAVGADSEAPGTTDQLADLASLSEEEIQKLVPETTIHSQS